MADVDYCNGFVWFKLIKRNLKQVSRRAVLCPVSNMAKQNYSRCLKSNNASSIMTADRLHLTRVYGWMKTQERLQIHFPVAIISTSFFGLLI